MRDMYFVMLAAKYLPPVAFAFHIFSYFFSGKSEAAENGAYALLFFGWWAACEVCSAYTKLSEEKHGADK